MCICVPIPEFPVLSNGALFSALSLILCTGKCNQLFTETVLASNLHFQHIGLNWQENHERSPPFERALDFGIESAYRFIFVCICIHTTYMLSAFEEHGTWEYSPTDLLSCVPQSQTNRNIHNTFSM